MKHEVIWSSVDNLAKKHKMSPSKMAKTVGLDATTFNKSKRYRADGKKKWPSLNSINKILDYFNISFEDFYQTSPLETFSSLPILKYSNISLTNNKINFNNKDIMGEESLKNLDFSIILNTSKFEPIYKNNSIIILSKEKELRRGDRILLINKNNQPNLYEFISSKNSTIELQELEASKQKIELKNNDITLTKRIVWSSQ